MSSVEKQTLRLFELRKEEQQEKLLHWWQQLQHNTGNRAELRRCHSPEDAATKADTFRVYNMVGHFCSIEASATIAGLLSHIKPESEFDYTPFGKKLSAVKEGGEKPVFSESRFRHLLKSRNWNEFYTNMRRAIVVLDGRIHPLYIADIILRWDKEQKPDYIKRPGQSLRFRLAQDYYYEIIRREEKQ
jgi:CRISPR system Cascade subunit CasB